MSLLTERLVADLKADSTDDYVKLLFYHVRNELRASINNANWINENLSAFLMDRLNRMELQIGLTDRVTGSEDFVNSYYEDFMVTVHTNNLEARWDFIKRKMEHSLQNGTSRDER